MCRMNLHSGSPHAYIVTGFPTRSSRSQSGPAMSAAQDCGGLYPFTFYAAPHCESTLSGAYISVYGGVAEPAPSHRWAPLVAYPSRTVAERRPSEGRLMARVIGNGSALAGSDCGGYVFGPSAWPFPSGCVHAGRASCLLNPGWSWKR